MKDVNATLRRIDEEIVGCKQSIARNQVEIARLQDTRLVLMHLVENDQAAEQRAKLERVSVIAGSSARPELIVRKVGTGGEDGSASRAAKTGMKVAAKRTTRDYKIDSAKYGRRGGESAIFREKVLALLAPSEEMTSAEIGDHLGLRRNQKVRKPMSNALYQLLMKGVLVRDEEKRYRLAGAP